jgi:DNA-binding transcriptional MerR regulator
MRDPWPAFADAEREFTMVETRDDDVDMGVDAAVPISVAARRVGLSVDTLRIWERRYGLGPSRTSPGGHRRYGEGDLRRLRAAVHLLRSGVQAGEAVRTVLAATPGRSGAAEVADTRLRLAADVHSGVHQLAAAALDLDGPGVRRLIGAELAVHGVVATWEGMLRPLLAAIGEQWERVPYTIAVEHLLSHIATAALAGPASPAAGPARAGTGPVLLACVPHEEHELPLTALSAALGEQGVPATLLGARTPAGATHTAAARTAARSELLSGALPVATTVVLLAVVADHADPALLCDVPGSVRLIAAGPGWQGTGVPRGVAWTDGLADALRLVLDS